MDTDRIGRHKHQLLAIVDTASKHRVNVLGLTGQAELFSNTDNAVERHTYDQFFHLASTSDDQLTLILRNANASPALTQQLEPIFAAKRTVTDLDRQVKSKQSSIDQITEDQKRLRENLSVLKGTAEERALAKRYTDELNQQEDKLATLRKDLDTLHQQHDAAQQDLSNKIESLNINEKLNS